MFSTIFCFRNGICCKPMVKRKKTEETVCTAVKDTRKLYEDIHVTGGFLLLRNFSVTISVSPHVCFILV